VIPEPIRTCQCKGPECVAVNGLRSLPCRNDMTSEDLLCSICREFKGKQHCHVRDKLCPIPVEYPVEGLEYLEYVTKYVENRYYQR
jgi:hypothetical protein